MPTEFIAQCKDLKHIVFLGTGASSYMDVPALNRLGVKVHTIKGYGDTAVAEHTVALMFACCRDLARMDRAVRAGTWEPLEGMQLTGKTLGLIGLGGIGGEVVRIARGIGMEVIAWNRTPRPDAGVPLVDLDTLLARADVVSLQLALNDGHARDHRRGRIARMKPGAILINTARGALVDEAALIEALGSGHIRHAGLDVFHAEPLQPGSSAGAHGQRDAVLARGVPHARSVDDPGAARDRHRAPNRRPSPGLTGHMKLSGAFPVVMGLPPEKWVHDRSKHRLADRCHARARAPPQRRCRQL